MTVGIIWPLEAPLAYREGLEPRRLPAGERTAVLTMPPQTGPDGELGVSAPLGHICGRVDHLIVLGQHFGDDRV